MTKGIPLPTAIWSSDWSEQTGQTIVTKRVFEHQTGVRWIKATYGAAGLASIVGVVGAVLRLYLAALTRRYGQVYLVSSRSLVGFIRDLPALMLVFVGIRVITHVHGSDIVQLLETSRVAWLARCLYRRCEIVVPSAHLIEDVQRLTGKAPVLCENFVDSRDIDAIIATEASPDDIWVTWNSNVMSSKGIFEVAGAVETARETDNRFKFLSIGTAISDDEMTKEQAETRITDLARQDWVTYLGRVSPDEALRATQKAKIYAFPSRYSSECQPLALIQAMMLGKPIVANDTPALRATLKGYPAIFLTAPTTDDLAQVFVRCSEGGEDTPGFKRERLESAAAFARERFSTARFDQAMSAILVPNASVCVGT